MRRKDREVTSMEEIEEIIKQCKTCHMAMIDEDKPYVVPLNFGYELEESCLTVYFHSAKEGRKISILKKNNNVCFEMSVVGEPVNAEKTPCNSGYYFSGIIGNGKIQFVDDISEKCKALSLLMKQQTGKDFEFNEKQADTVCVYKVSTEDFCGKKKVKASKKSE